MTRRRSLTDTLYRAARLSADVRAVRKGRYPQRVARRAVYRHVNRRVAWVLRRLGL